MTDVETKPLVGTGVVMPQFEPMLPAATVEYRVEPEAPPHVMFDVNGNPMPDVSVETITPPEATQYLESNDNVRKLRQNVVDRYAADMLAGRWFVGTSVIGFDQAGNLRCGQHRLTACVQANVPFTTIVSRGITQDVVDNDDMGLKRTQSDILKAKGEVSAHGLAACIANSWRWDRGLMMQTITPTPSQVSEYLAANPGLREATGASQAFIGPPLHARVSAIGPFIYRIRQISPDFAEAFLKRLHTGADLSEHDAILRLRQYYLAKRANQYGRPSKQHEAALCVKAWNAWIQGRPVKALRWGRGGVANEEFPQLLDLEGKPYPFPEVVAEARARAGRAAEG